MTNLVTSVSTRAYFSNQLHKMVQYTVVPMDKLDFARNLLHESLKSKNIQYKLRTFYSGPRRGWNATTNKEHARFAKIAIYTKKEAEYGSYYELTAYL